MTLSFESREALKNALRASAARWQSDAAIGAGDENGLAFHGDFAVVTSGKSTSGRVTRLK
jgi:hypothetical protein